MREYDDKKLIRSGSFGSVYKVKKGDAFYALKEMTDKGVRDREEKFLKLADHPLFPKFEESYDEDGKYYILEEYIWGTPLDEAITLRKGFGQPEAMKFAVTVADGIAFLQQSDGNILFRDLKAENLILQPDGEIRLVDLGTACYLEEADRSRAGTAGNSAPEQIDNKSKQGLYSDVYAFGMLFYHMLTGQKAPSGGKYVSVRKTDPTYSASLELLIRECTMEETSARIPDMYTVLTRLMDIAMQSPSGYKKIEKEAERVLKDFDGSERIVYSRNIQS
ncbi:MAG: protein kinase [Lachnospiraceae bacterium]|nr:protein kinase [Lachnospiraceae bacterium]